MTSISDKAFRVFPKPKYKEQKIQLNIGDKIFQYTDGVTEATDKDNQLYGMDRLHKVLNEKCLDCNPEQTLKLVKEDIDAFVGDNDQFDDITMLCLEYKTDDFFHRCTHTAFHPCFSLRYRCPVLLSSSPPLTE